MAVYTPLSADQIDLFLRESYEEGRVIAAEGIAEGVENTNYKLTIQASDASQHTRILTLYEKRVDPEELPFFLGLMQHLAARDYACPLPIPRKDGAWVGPLAGKMAAMVTFLSGKSRLEYTPDHARSAGEALARLHQAGEGFAGRRANNLSLEGWQKLAEGLAGKWTHVAEGIEAEIVGYVTHLAKEWHKVAALPEGIIHADYFPDNVFFQGDAVSGVIDFYFACWDALAYDLAIAVNAWCFAPDGTLDREKSSAMIAGYQAVRPLTVAEKDLFPLLMQGAAMRFFLTRAQDWVHQEAGALVTVKNPREYLMKLRFHANIEDATVYGDLG